MLQQVCSKCYALTRSGSGDAGGGFVYLSADSKILPLDPQGEIAANDIPTRTGESND